MTEEANTKQKVPFAKQAARASVVAPGVAVLLNVLTLSATHDSRVGKLVVGSASSCLIIVGLVCAVIGLLGIRKYGRKGILGRSIAGLLINLFIIASAVFTLHTMLRIREQRMQPAFTISMPSSFVSSPAGMQQPGVLHSYMKGDPTDQIPDIVCLVEGLGGTIPKGDDLSSFVDARPDVTLLKEMWKGHEIEVLRIRENLQGAQVLTFNAQVPLVPQALQVKLVGMMEREEELRRDLRKILEGIDGPTNW